MRQAFPLLAFLLSLTGCWTGPILFAPADAVKALEDGRYRMIEPGADAGAGDHLVVKGQADGSLMIYGPEHPWRAIVAPLPQAGKERFVLQLSGTNPERPEQVMKATYMLLDKRGRHPTITILRCDTKTAAAVKASGGFVASDPQSASSCVFSDLATLRDRLAIAARISSRPDIELVRMDE